MYDVPDQTGRLAIVTGANSGTGKEAAAQLAAAGADVVLAVRTPEKGEQARADIVARYAGRVRPQQLIVRQVDVADLTSVGTFAELMAEVGRPIDMLLNNAGVMAVPQRMTTVDGFELQLGTNFLGPFALTLRLLPLLLKAEAPRVTAMSSMAAYAGQIAFDDLQAERRYRPWDAYNQSKLADLLFGLRLAGVAAERGWRLTSTVAHPGFVRTNLQKAGASLGGNRPGALLRLGYALMPANPLRLGVQPLLFAAADPAAVNSGFYGPRFVAVGPRGRAALPRQGRDGDAARRLWELAEQLTGQRLADSP